MIPTDAPTPLAATSAMHPVTPLQFGMIYHFVREGGETGVDIVQVEVTLDGDSGLDLVRLESAWRQVVAAHPALRSDFRWGGGEEPMARVHPRVPVRIEEVDLESASAPAEAHDPDDRYQAWLEADRVRGFDLGEAPLFRLHLVSLGSGRRRLVWTLHHVIADGQSYRRVLADVFARYDNPDREADPPVPTSPTPEDFVRWLGERIDTGDEAFWRKALDEVTAPTALPRRSGGGRTPGSWHVREAPISDGMAESLDAAAREFGVTVNTLVQGAWALALSTFSGEHRVTFGAIRGGRSGTLPGIDQSVGLFINTVPLAVEVDPEARLSDFLQEVRDRWVAMRAHEHASPSRIQQWSGVGAGDLLFESVLNVQAPFWGDALVADDPTWRDRRVEIYNPLVFPLVVAVNLGDPSRAQAGAPGLRIRFEFDPGELDEGRILALRDLFMGYLESVVEIASGLGEPASECTLGALDPLPSAVREQIVTAWNATDRPLPIGATVHGLVAEAAARWPDAEAVASGGESQTFAQLAAASHAVARALQARGVGRGDRVVVSMGRGVTLPAALLGVLRTGAAYVPVDPAYPEARVAMMLEDARPAALVTDAATRGRLSVPPELPVVVVDHLEDEDGGVPVTDARDPGALAYVIYTSGSTGRPKGVMVEHRNVVAFFVGMDHAVGASPGDRWLAVTSISFDISVLEILWTLARGGTVELYAQRRPEAGAHRRIASCGAAAGASPRSTTLDFSLFFFSAEGGEGAEAPPPGRHRYRLLLEGAAFADRHGLSAIWTPERHFHEFGGIYPNPSVTGGAIAAITERVRIRAGSVVLPLHDPIRVAEEWSVIDNLSNGRVDLAFASGWHDRDFVLRPGNFVDRKEGMFEQMREVQRLWRGDTVERTGPSGQTHVLALHPRPVQPELPVFVTAGGSPETFRRAGEVGAHLLTHLLGQRPEDLQEKIRIYRAARRTAGHPGEGKVAIMLHTWVGPSMEEVRAQVAVPFRNYLRTAVGLIRAVAEEDGKDLREARLAPREMDALLDHAFERYFESSSLMGDVDRCIEVAARMKALGADEIACLIDFGVDEDRVVEGLDRLGTVARAFGAATFTEQGENAAEGVSGEGDTTGRAVTTVAGEILRSGATHLQCTPSQAALLLAEEGAMEALAQLRVLLLGGEALPGELAGRLRQHLPPDARLLNMYGPTETTVWSAVREVEPGDAELAVVPLGPPTANTRLLVVDRAGRPVPPGVEGDLLIGGAAVGRGYLDRPELTEACFIPSPVPEFSGRFYRTGDRVRMRADGGLDFVGRADHQVKLRGHRIELGEIEAVLAGHPDVASAVVLLQGEAEGMPRLVAWVVPSAGGKPSNLSRVEIRSWLRHRLPEIMLPADVILVNEFPLTPNGKVDRTRVSRAASWAGAAEAASPGPATPGDSPLERPAGGVRLRTVQEDVGALWRELLGLETVSLHDNFFEVGGHSLLAVRIHSRLSEWTGGKLSLVDIFRYPTVATLSAHLLGLVDMPEAGVDTAEQKVRDRAASRRESMASLRSRRMERRRSGGTDADGSDEPGSGGGDG
jgi:natural product biosynthesis luciferase-like monooxygenase protein